MNVPYLQQLLTNNDSLHEENEHKWNINKALLDPFREGAFPGLKADGKSFTCITKGRDGAELCFL